MIEVITAPTAALSLADAKAYARIDGNDDDVLVQSLVFAAQSQVEEYTGRAAALGTFRWVSERWPDWHLDTFYRFPAFRRKTRRILLPRSPLVAVSSVKYFDASGVEQIVSSSEYTLDKAGLPGSVIFRPDFDLPDLDGDSGRNDAVSVTFTAGVTDPILSLAIKMLVNHFYELRVPVITGTIATEIPMSVRHLLRSKRVESPFET